MFVLDRSNRPALEDAKRGDVFGEVAQADSLSVGHAAKIELDHHFIACGPKRALGQGVAGLPQVAGLERPEPMQAQPSWTLRQRPLLCARLMIPFPLRR